MKIVKILFVVLVLGIWIYNYIPNPITSTEYYTIKPNDTLWNIAEQYTEKDSRYINEIIYDIVKDNPEIKNSQLYPGQTIVINIH